MGALIKILKKDPFVRTPHEVAALFQGVRHLSCFKHLTQFVLSELCRKMRHYYIDAGKAVFRQGSVGLVCSPSRKRWL
jgi:hypothetical protein